MTDINSFSSDYTAAALFADCTSDDETYGKDWARETDARFAADAEAFYAAHEADIRAYEAATGSNAGHDLWFTRRGHGVGYWEHAGLPAADRLDTAARALGDLYLYVGDDDLVYAA